MKIASLQSKTQICRLLLRLFGVISAAPLMTKPIVLRNLIRYNMFRSGLPFNISYVYEPAIIKFKAKISIKDEQTVTEMDKYKTSNSFKTKKKPLLYVRGLSLAFLYY